MLHYAIASHLKLFNAVIHLIKSLVDIFDEFDILINVHIQNRTIKTVKPAPGRSRLDCDDMSIVKCSTTEMRPNQKSEMRPSMELRVPATSIPFFWSSPRMLLDKLTTRCTEATSSSGIEVM